MYLEKIGNYDYDGKELKCDFLIDANTFFERFPNVVGNYSSSVINDIKDAINSSSYVKISRRNRDDVQQFFDEIEEVNANLVSGPNNAEEDEITEESSDSDSSYEEEDSSSSYAPRGDQEGEGLLIPFEVIETTNLVFAHNEDVPKEESKELKGQVKIKNPSSKDRVWDIGLKIKHDQDLTWESKGMDIGEGETIENSNEETGETSSTQLVPIYIKNLDNDQEIIYDYTINEYEAPSLKIHEFISTINDEEVESYALRANVINTILFKIIVENTSDSTIEEIEIKKEIFEGFTDIQIISDESSKEEKDASEEDGGVVWRIDSLEPGAESSLKINMTIEASDSAKANTGKIVATYKAKSSLTGMGIEDFKAYSTNYVGIETAQNEEDPDAYTCALLFENKSDFQIALSEIEVKEEIEEGLSEESLVGLPEEESILISTSREWKSEEWVSTTESGIEPVFHKKVDFTILSEQLISSTGTITIEDLTLATAMIEGYVYYSVGELQSYRETVFNALLEARNSGNANFNDLIFQDTIQAGYIPPTTEQIQVYLVRGDEVEEASAAEIDEDMEEEIDEDAEDEIDEDAEDEIDEDAEDDEPEVKGSKISEDEVAVDESNQIDWEDLGELIEIDPSLISIEPADQDPDKEHVVKVDLSNLKDGPLGIMSPNTIVRVKYPIKAYNPEMGTEYDPNIAFTANTLPAGSPFQFGPENAEEIIIPIIHIRKKLRRGKEIKGLSESNKFQITLSVTDIGEHPSDNIKMRDVVNKNSFNYGDYSIEPTEIQKLDGKDILIWEIEHIEPEETIEISYTITGKGNFHVKDSQESL